MNAHQMSNKVLTKHSPPSTETGLYYNHQTNQSTLFPTHGVQLDLSADKGFHDKFDQLGVTDLWVSHHAGCSWKRISPKKRKNKKKEEVRQEKAKKKQRKRQRTRQEKATKKKSGKTTNEIQHHLTQSTGHRPKDRDWFPQQGVAHVVFHTVDVGQCFAMYHVFLGKSKGVVHCEKCKRCESKQ